MANEKVKTKTSSLRRPILLVVLAVLALAGWKCWSLSKRIDPNAPISASGTIEATEIIISPKIAGRVVHLLVDEGSVVKAGDPVADLDPIEVRAQADAAGAALAHANAQWDEARNGNRPEQIAQARAQLAQAQATVAGAYSALVDARLNFSKVTELKANVDAAKTHLDAMIAARSEAEAALKLSQEGTRRKQIDQAQAAVSQAQVQLARDERDAKRYDELFKDSAISRQQWDNALSARDTSQAALRQARAHLADLVAGSRPEEIRESEMALSQSDATVEGANLALENARVQYNDRLDSKTKLDAAVSANSAAQAQERAAKAQLDLLAAGSREEDLRAAKDAVKQARANLDYAREQIVNTHVLAPAAGVIETKSSEIGEVLAAGAPIVTLDDLDHTWLRVYVPENLYGRIKLNQHVEIKVDSYPSTTFHGVVVEIASSAEFTPKSVQTEEERVKMVYGIKVDIDNRDHRLKPGMPADATFRKL